MHHKRVKRRRFFWIALPALWVASLLAVRVIWGWYAHAQVQFAANELARAGVRSQHPPSSHDATTAFALRQVITQINLAPDDVVLVNEGDAVASLSSASAFWSASGRQRIGNLLEEYRPLIESLDAPPAQSLPPLATGDYLPPRHLAFLLNAQVRLQQETGGNAATADAMQSIRRMLRLGQWIDATHTQSGHLAASSIRTLAVTAFERLEPTLVLQGPALVEARNLAAVLAELPLAQEGAALGHEGQLDLAVQQEWISRQLIFNGWWLEPLKNQELARSLRNGLANVEGMGKPTWPEAMAAMGRPVRPRPAGAAWGLANLHILTRSISDGSGLPSPYLLPHFRTLTDLSAASVLLAAHLHRAQHGAFPPSAEALVPGTLSQLPRDVFATDVRPLRYRVDPSGISVWSVGENAVDDGGKVLLDASGIRFRRYGNSPRSQLDMVYGRAWSETR